MAQLDPDRSPTRIPDSELPGPYPVGAYAAQLKRRLLEFARVQLVGEVWGFRSRRARVYFELRDARGALPVLDVGCTTSRRSGVALDRRDAGRRRRRLRLLPGQRLVLPVVHLRGLRAADRRRGRPARPARAAAPPARTPTACSSRRSGSTRPLLPRTIGVVTGERGKARDDVLAGLRRRGWAGRLVWAFVPVQDRHAAPADRRRAARAGGDRGGRGRDRRARRRLARRPVRVLRRGAVPDRRAAARAGDLVGRPPHRPHADRRRGRRVAARRRPTPPRPRSRSTAAPLAPSATASARRLRAPQPPRDPRPGADARATSPRAPAQHVARHRRQPAPAAARAARERATRASPRGASGPASTCSCSGGPPSAPGAPSGAARGRELERLALALAAHDPERTLARGYALVEDRAGEPLSSAAAARAAGDIRLRFHDGAVDATRHRRVMSASEPQRHLRDRGRADRGDHPPARLRRGRAARDARAGQGGTRPGRVLRRRARRGRARASRSCGSTTSSRGSRAPGARSSEHVRPARRPPARGRRLHARGPAGRGLERLRAPDARSCT